jgi:pimeloyl-ACP methyl ester carboxylesterase
LLALDHPDVFDAAVLVGGNSGLQDHLEPHIAAYREHADAGKLADYHRLHLRRGVTAAWADTPLAHYLIEGFVERGRALNADSIGRVFQAVARSDLTDRLASLQIPVLIVNGEHDSAFAGGARTAGLIAGAERQIIAGAGHCCFLEEPDRFDAVVQAFLTPKQCWPADH